MLGMNKADQRDVGQIKTEFVNIASHQLRTPITSIRLHTEMLLQNASRQLETEHVKYLMNIAESTERMVQLVNDLLYVVRIETNSLHVEPSDVDVKKFVQAIIKKIDAEGLNKHCVIRFEGKGRFPKVHIDEELIYVVVMNLILNAIQYSREEKECFVDVKLDKIKNFRGSFVQIQVTDYGIGIPKKDQKSVFKKFFRAQNAMEIQTEGSGIGLFVAHRIVELSHGKLSFTSSKNGTTFTLLLPASPSKK